MNQEEEKKGYKHLDSLEPLERKYEGIHSPVSLHVRTHLNGPTNKLLAVEVIKALSL